MFSSVLLWLLFALLVESIKDFMLQNVRSFLLPFFLRFASSSHGIPIVYVRRGLMIFGSALPNSSYGSVLCVRKKTDT